MPATKEAAAPLVESLEPRVYLSLCAISSEADLSAVLYCAGDAYQASGSDIPLMRVKGAMVIGLSGASEDCEALDDLLGTGGALEGYHVSETVGGHGVLLEADPSAPIPSAAQTESLLELAGSLPCVQWAAPVFWNAESGLAQVAGNEIIVGLNPGVAIGDVVGADVLGYRPLLGTSDQYIHQIQGAGAHALAAAAAYSTHEGIAWAEPNFYGEVQNCGLDPQDPLYLNGDQWYLDKINASGAWDTTTGWSDIVVAVLEAGVQIAHPDLAPNVWHNPGEIPDNGIDDDSNGYIDDVFGWAFVGSRDDGWLGNNDVGHPGAHGT